MAADLHAHTYFSDAADSPQTLVKLALERGRTTLAVTDHDTVEGNKRAREPVSYTHLDVYKRQCLVFSSLPIIQ